MRLIDADELTNEVIHDMAIAALHSNVKYFSIVNDIVVAFSETIAHAPTIDAVGAVRCKDCKYLERNYCDEYGDLEPLFCKNWVAGVDEDGYCYEAERREPWQEKKR